MVSRNGRIRAPGRVAAQTATAGPCATPRPLPKTSAAVAPIVVTAPAASITRRPASRRHRVERGRLRPRRSEEVRGPRRPEDRAPAPARPPRALEVRSDRETVAEAAGRAGRDNRWHALGEASPWAQPTPQVPLCTAHARGRTAVGRAGGEYPRPGRGNPGQDAAGDGATGATTRARTGPRAAGGASRRRRSGRARRRGSRAAAGRAPGRCQTTSSHTGTRSPPAWPACPRPVPRRR